MNSAPCDPKRPPVLIELVSRPGLETVSLARLDENELADRSAKALDNAMDTIYQMADRVNATLNALPGNPEEVKLEFGLTLDLEGQALVAKVGA